MPGSPYTLLKTNFVERIYVRIYARADNIGRNSAAGKQLSIVSKLYKRGAHSLIAARYRLDSEIVQLVVMSRNLLQCEERRVNRAVAYAQAVQNLVIFVYLDVRGRSDNIAVVYNVAFQLLR